MTTAFTTRCMIQAIMLGFIAHIDHYAPWVI
jgi:hypothetical protein